MGFKSRKLFVGLISLAAVFAAYLLVTRLSDTAPIDIDAVSGPADGSVPAGRLDVDESSGDVGMVTDEVGVETVEMAEFITLNKQKQVERKFGFEKLLHEVDDEWEIEKPYMTIFRSNFKCHITAATGKVRVETTAGGKPQPKDATLTGNVVVHVLPEIGSDVKESFVYLDDVIYISEKSQFSTAGPVKFVSADAQMLGKGLELVYNEQAERLEFLRIKHLDSLRLKNSELPLSSSPNSQTASTEIKAEMRPGLASKTSGTQKSRQVKAAEEKGERYRCLFSKNVLIDSPEQLVFADELSINNILWSKGSEGKSANADVTGRTLAEPADAAAQTFASQKDQDSSIAEAGFATAKQAGDIVVTCDNGMLFAPMDSPIGVANFVRAKSKDVSIESRSAKSIDDANGRTTMVARRIDYYEDTDRIIFKGDCKFSMLKADSKSRQKYNLSAPRLTVDLFGKDAEKPSSASAGNIKHITANGGIVRLETLKMAMQKPTSAKGLPGELLEESLGGVKLKCVRFDYDPGQEVFLATGPGIIAVDNSKVPQPTKQVSKFSSKRPSYSIVRDFASLEYSSLTNQIVADNKSRRILIDYFPVYQNGYIEPVSAAASHIEARLTETGAGRFELSTLSATDGISYEEEGVQFEGERLFYNADESVITAWGDEVRPCLLNGAVVEALEYDLKAGKITTMIAGPGAF